MADTGDKQWFQEPNKKPNKGNKQQTKGNSKSSGKPNTGKNYPKSSNKQPVNGKPNVANANKPANSKAVPAKGTPAKAAPAKKPKKFKNKKKNDKKPSYMESVKKAEAELKKNEQVKAEITNEPEIKDTSKKAKKADNSFGANQRKRAKKKSLSRAFLAIGVTLAALMIVYFGINYLYDYIAAKPEFMFVSKGSVEHTIGARAIIVRDETVVKTTHSGDLVTRATEGGRVSKGQPIAMVVPDEMASTVEKLRNTQNQISEVQQELIAAGKADGADAIYDDINNSIAPIINMIRLDAMTGNMSNMSSYSSSISVLITQRESKLSEMNFDDERLNVLRNDEASYERILENSADRIYAPVPGIISYKLDGQEDSLSFEYLMTADPSAIDDIISSSVGAITSDLYINENEPLARIAKNEEQYIAVFIDNTDAAAFEVGSLHTLNISSEGISIERCKVERSVVTSDGLLIVFSTTRYVEDLLDLRTVDIEIVITETKGLKVPVSSLVKPDYDRGVATIYINKQGFAEEVTVLIVDNDREFAIIAPTNEQTVPNTETVIITNPSSIKPGEKVTN